MLCVVRGSVPSSHTSNDLCLCQSCPSVRDDVSACVELWVDPCREMMHWDAAADQCFAGRRLPELPFSGKGVDDSKAALYLHGGNFHRCSPNQVLLLAGTGLRGTANLV